jgi:hypothetical protein
MKSPLWLEVKTMSNNNMNPEFKTKRKNEQGRTWRFWVLYSVGMFVLGVGGSIAVFGLFTRSNIAPAPFISTLTLYSLPAQIFPPPIEDFGFEADVRLDVAFLVDASGSMSDELANIQNNIIYISQQIDDLPINVHTRYAFISFKDRQDPNPFQVFNFTTDVNTFQQNISQLRADGGNESLEDGLMWAMDGLSWRGENTIKLLFLVTDEQPNLRYADTTFYTDNMLKALERGIKIHTIASGGLPPDGEFALRQISQATFGRFIFLTYNQEGQIGTTGQSRPDLNVGTPAQPNEPASGDYSVENLDELVLRLIQEEISYVSP